MSQLPFDKNTDERREQTYTYDQTGAQGSGVNPYGVGSNQHTHIVSNPKRYTVTVKGLTQAQLQEVVDAALGKGTITINEESVYGINHGL